MQGREMALRFYCAEGRFFQLLLATRREASARGT
jgi:hypothetical protein